MTRQDALKTSFSKSRYTYYHSGLPRTDFFNISHSRLRNPN